MNRYFHKVHKNKLVPTFCICADDGKNLFFLSVTLLRIKFIPGTGSCFQCFGSGLDPDSIRPLDSDSDSNPDPDLRPLWRPRDKLQLLIVKK